MADFRLLPRKKALKPRLQTQHVAKKLPLPLSIRSLCLHKNKYQSTHLKSECEYPFTFDL